MDGAGGPPPEMIPGFYDDRSGLVIFCVVFCLTIATFFVSLRIWTRKFIINKMGADDWAAIIALIITWGEGISIAIETKYGLGKHIFAIQPPTLIPIYWKTFWTTLLLYHAGLCAAKMTFLLQYYRIFALQRMRIVYIIAIVIVGAWSFAQILIALLICRPIQGLWDKTIEAECMPNAPQIYVNAGGNIITDVAIFLLPLPAIKHLNLQKRQKALLVGIFSLGFFTVAISVIRIKFLNIDGDVTWQHVESSGWSIGELACALTCSSLPTLRPFIAKYFPSLGLSSSQDSAPSYAPHTIGGSGGRQNKSKASSGLGTNNMKSVYETRNPISHETFGDKTDYELRAPSTARGSGEVSSITDEERLLGMRQTTKTEIHRSDSDPRRVEEGQGPQIQVQRAIHQSTKVRGERGW